jgi:hypothetical protein
MPTPPDSEVNPYAPPASEVGVREAAIAESQIERPKSVKWTIAVFLLLVAGLVITSGQFIYGKGWGALITGYRVNPSYLATHALFTAALTALLVGGRRPVVYWITTFSLALGCFNIANNLRFEWARAASHLGGEEIGNKIGLVIFSFLLVYLFYRFTFGRPSRTYFRMSRQ